MSEVMLTWLKSAVAVEPEAKVPALQLAVFPQSPELVDVQVPALSAWAEWIETSPVATAAAIITRALPRLRDALAGLPDRLLPDRNARSRSSFVTTFEANDPTLNEFVVRTILFSPLRDMTIFRVRRAASTDVRS
jgi:hypothetical protein